MRPRDLKLANTRRSYHDAHILETFWPKPDELAIKFAVDTHWNPTSPPEATVFFSGVQNRQEVETGLAQLNSHSLCSIEGLFTSGPGEFVLQGITIRCRSIYEA